MGVKAMLNSLNPVMVAVVLASPTSTPPSFFRIQEIPPGGPDNIFLQLMYFTEDRTDLPREAIGPNWVQLLLEGFAPVFQRKPKGC